MQSCAQLGQLTDIYRNICTCKMAVTCGHSWQYKVSNLPSQHHAPPPPPPPSAHKSSSLVTTGKTFDFTAITTTAAKTFSPYNSACQKVHYYYIENYNSTYTSAVLQGSGRSKAHSPQARKTIQLCWIEKHCKRKTTLFEDWTQQPLR